MPEISNVATGLGLLAHDVFNPLLMVSTELPSLILHLTIVCLQELGFIQSRLQLKCELETGLGAGDYWANWRKSSAAQ